MIERYKGKERESKMAELRAAYGDKIKEAPKAANETAEKWVQEVSRSWDKPDDDSMFRSLQLRNAVLNACRKSATEAGF